MEMKFLSLQETELYLVVYRSREGTLRVFNPSVGSDLKQVKFWRNVMEHDHGTECQATIMKLAKVE